MANTTKEDYYHHLMIIQDRLQEYMVKMQNGQLSYIMDTAQKLRILFLRKSRVDSLLKTIQEQYGFELKVRKPRNMGDLFSTLNQATIVYGVVSGPSMWFTKGLEQISILDAFSIEGAVAIEGKSFSIKRIAEVIADKMGGAHIDPIVGDDDLLPHSNSILIGGLNAAEKVILDTADASITAINMISDFIENNEETDFLKRVWSFTQKNIRTLNYPGITCPSCRLLRQV